MQRRGGRCLRRFAMNPAKLANLLQEGAAHHRAGRLVDAEKSYERARVAAPRSFDAFHLSGFLALQRGRCDEAANLLERAFQLNPRSGVCALRLAHALKKSGRQAEARDAARRAASLEPANADVHFCLGELAAALEGFAAAVPHFRRVTELQPGAADGWANLGVALAQSGEPDVGVACFDRALAIDPADAQALSGRALALQQAHRITDAIAAYDQVLARHPGNHEARSARLLSLHYTDTIDRDALWREHLAFGHAVREGARVPAPSLAYPPEPERRLRVAFLSPDLRAHSVAYFMEPLLAHLDRAQFEIFLYHDHARVDAVSERLRAMAAQWRHFAGWPNDRVEAAIRTDAPDILVDLAGHTGFNRLPLFARRLAPVQMTYLGYPDTTGVAEMDYRFTDAIADPVGEAEAFHTEQLVRFAPTAWCYAPPAEAPEPMRLDGGGDEVTFGCFNNFSKVSDITLRLWGEVLASVPGSRLLLKSNGLDEPRQQERARERLAQAGIDVGRVELIGRIAGAAEHLGCYRRVDVALDTFPYHGTTTTCEALWMGVPVVTLAGDQHMSRVGVSLLAAIGRAEWIAHTPTDYARIAVALAAAGPRRPEECNALRYTFQKSPLLDHAGQAAAFGAAVRQCWQEWCERGATASDRTRALVSSS
jgi:predicted O-linked N-acetylglucosamine transferase (SPINDLY family)